LRKTKHTMSLDSTSFSTPASVTKPSMTYGLILGCTLVATSLATHFAGLGFDSSISKLLPWLAMIGILYYALSDFKTKFNSGYLSYGTGVKLSVLTGVWAGIVSSLYTYIFFQYIAPEVTEELLVKAAQDMADQGMGDAEIEQALEISQVFMTPATFAFMNLFAVPLMTLIIGLILSAILKKDA
jgi:hypothetical protein